MNIGSSSQKVNPNRYKSPQRWKLKLHLAQAQLTLPQVCRSLGLGDYHKVYIAIVRDTKKGKMGEEKRAVFRFLRSHIRKNQNQSTSTKGRDSHAKE